MLADYYRMRKIDRPLDDAFEVAHENHRLRLVVQDGKLAVVSSPNQDSSLMDNSATPILGVDIWENAYYLLYQNKHADYLTAGGTSSTGTWCRNGTSTRWSRSEVESKVWRVTRTRFVLSTLYS